MKKIIDQIVDSGLTPYPKMLDHSDEELQEICNACGAKGSWLTYLIPQEYEGINFRPACHKHDFSYYVGETWEDKVEGDTIFLIDLMALCNQDISCSIDDLVDRHNRAKLYHWAVDKFGHHAWTGEKNKAVPLKTIAEKLPPIEDIRGEGDMY